MRRPERKKESKQLKSSLAYTTSIFAAANMRPGDDGTEKDHTWQSKEPIVYPIGLLLAYSTAQHSTD